MTVASLSPEEDRHLTLQLTLGNTQAFERLYLAYLPSVRAFLSRLQHAGTDDLAQEVFLRAWRYRHRFRGDCSAKTYFIAIARNVLREQFRSHQHRTGLSTESLDQFPAPHPEPPQLDLTLIATLDHAKATLPANQLQAIELVYYLGIRPAQAALLAGCSCKAMRRRLEHARAHLRHLLLPPNAHKPRPFVLPIPSPGTPAQPQAEGSPLNDERRTMNDEPCISPDRSSFSPAPPHAGC